MKRGFVFLFMFIVLFQWSCNEVKDWSDPKDDIPPGIVTDLRVENINGGAVIFYKRPADEDLMAVKAVYSFTEGGIEREAFSSAYNDSIRLEGFPDILERSVYLYAVDKSGNESLPVEVKIQPLIPPVELIRQSLQVNSTFGGIHAFWENELQDEISVTLYTKDQNDDFDYYEAYYSKAGIGKYSFRGLEDIPQDFRLLVRDKWDNYSTPLDTIITPLFEEEIPGRDQSGYIWDRWGYVDRTCLYRGDDPGQIDGRPFELIHDGNAWGTNTNWWHTPASVLNDFVSWPVSDYRQVPFYFTIDMGRMASYSRLRYWMRDRTPVFSAQIFTSLEVWGTNDPKPLNEIGDGSKEDNLKYWTDWEEIEATGEWRNDWTKLADFVLELPSGTLITELLTDEDREFVAAGFEVEMDSQYADTPFRYIRFVIRESREPNNQIQLAELKFWGAYVVNEK